MTQPPPPPNAIQMLITFVPGPGGGIQVHGPVQDKVLCLGMLETAKESILDHHKAQAGRAPIEVVSGSHPLLNGRH